MYQQLFSEGRIGNLTLQNRIIMTAMGVDCAEPDGSAGQRVCDYYEERAKGGVGLIITEVTRVNDTHGLALGGQLSMSNDAMIEPFSKLVDKVHSHGTKIFVQLHHPGRQNLAALAWSWKPLTKAGAVIPHFWDTMFKAGSYFEPTMLEDPRVVSLMKFMPPVVSASNIPTGLGASIIKHQPTRALMTWEVKRLERQFIEAAKRVQKAGADGVELHAAHGYLIQQFLSPYTNRRTDEYGGSLENRMRFLLNILTGIKKECGADFPVSVRLSVEEYYDLLGFEDRGIKLPEGLEMAKRVEAAGADLLNVSCGTYETLNTIIETMSFQPGWRTHLAKAVKDVVSIPVAGVGVIRTPEQAEELLESGNQDFIGLGRPLLADPHWPAKAKAGASKDIQRCISCVTCFETDEANALKGEPCECAMNPICCREYRYNDKTRKTDGDGRTVVVVGAGPGGLVAAREAAKRGFKTILLEKEAATGGQLNLAKMPPSKDRMEWGIADLTRGAENAGVDIRCGVEATKETLQELSPYAVILATGGVPVVPKIEGLDGDNVCTVAEVLSGAVTFSGKKVAVIGSGLTGLETAELLADQCNTVTVAEMADHIGPGIWAQHYWDIVPNLDKAGVNLLPGHKLTRVTDTSVFLETKDGNLKQIDVDAVVLSLGVRPVKDLEEAARAVTSNVTFIGDANKPGKIVHATRAGLEAAWAL